mgnify:CR=1 FL=1|tara:strand:- start:45 stop:260 length:216 start_codon:yes stop_codon:yes gene_type:complete
MEKLDLHGKTYYESEILVIDFIEKNLDKLPIKIVTGNSTEMQLIVNKIVKKYKLKSSPRTYYNLGCLIISK